MKRLTTIALILFASFAARADNIFDDSLFYEHYYTAYLHAIELNADDMHGLEAYNLIVKVQKGVDSVMRIHQKNPADLTDDEFAIYWPIKTSVAEIAYKLGLYTAMDHIAAELSEALLSRQADSTNPTAQGRRAQLAKIDGGRHLLRAEYEEAEHCLANALSLYPLQEDADFVLPVTQDLALVYYEQERYEEAMAQLEALLASSLLQQSHRFDMTSTRFNLRSQRALCLARMGKFGDALEAIDSVEAFYKKQKDERQYAEALRKKAKILMLSYDMSGIYTPLAATCYRKYLTLSRQFLDTYFIDMTEAEREQYWMSEQPFVTDCYRLEGHDPELLYDVALYGKSMLLQMGRQFKPAMNRAERQNALSAMRITWRDVQRGMPDSSAAVEFITYERAGKEHMAALVLGKTAKAPLFVHIAPTDELLRWRLPNGTTVKNVLQYPGGKSAINALYSDSAFNALIWNDSLVKAIGSSRTVFFVADGLFHQLAVEYLLPQTLEGRKFMRLTTTRLLAEKRRKLRNNNMLMVGGLSYKSAADSEEAAHENDALAYTLLASWDILFDSLHASRAEVDSILALRGNPADRVLHADSATEATVGSLLHKYHIVLLSTHGYFKEMSAAGSDLRTAIADVRLSCSGLILSGEMKNINDQHFDPSKPDGILSAREIAHMDLSEVDLVVLSACQTGLGYITADGVYGLQRGLKTAGVRAVVASLWEVDDDATARLMRYLYTNLEAGMPLSEAFATARRELKNTVVTERHYGFERERKPYDEPYCFNAFILIDGF
ncbi:MAG: CHAT domain-containing protein [Bacteroidales bacterium]|nr:CHAT domain-containing protein [Bacteroidales bacterium]